MIFKKEKKTTIQIEAKSFTNEELKWWESKKSKPIAMHPNDIAFIDKYINLFYEYENREYDIRTIFNQIKKEGK